MTELTYHDLSLPKLNYSDFVSRDEIKSANQVNDHWTKTSTGSKEALTFTTDAPQNMSMTTDISNNNLVTSRTSMIADKTADYSTTVSNPYGYGYISSLSETRNQDAKDILMQESTMFVLGAIAGVSLIVAGLLFVSSSDIVPPAPQ